MGGLIGGLSSRERKKLGLGDGFSAKERLEFVWICTSDEVERIMNKVRRERERGASQSRRAERDEKK
jgi:hypothetical protein